LGGQYTSNKERKYTDNKVRSLRRCTGNKVGEKSLGERRGREGEERTRRKGGGVGGGGGGRGVVEG
jgi:hypothetical protein